MSIKYFMVLALSLTLPTASYADNKPQKASALSLMLVYKPPAKGSPSSRVGGGTRGFMPSYAITPIAPDHTALTASAQPTLYWHITQNTNQDLQLVIENETDASTLLETKLKGPHTAGTHAVNLAQYKVSLTAGNVYQWYITSDAYADIKDALIQFKPISGTLKTQLSQANIDKKLTLYANSGFWYDTFALLSQTKSKPHLRQQQRAQLLQQINLANIAAPFKKEQK